MSYIDAPFNEVYHVLIQRCQDHGIAKTPRGKHCKELRPFHFQFRGDQGLYTGVSRKLNYRFFAVETLGFLGGMGKPGHQAYNHLLIETNKNIEQFLNTETGLFDGAYGPRMIESLPWIVELLSMDPDSRQAVCSIWNVGAPPVGSKDIPCTVSLHFFNDSMDHEPRLGCQVYMRSNDLNWGTPYDVAAFSSIQTTLALILGWNIGGYYHSCGSLHLYNESYGGAPTVTTHQNETWIPYDVLSPWMPENSLSLYRDIEEEKDRFLNISKDAEIYVKDLYHHRFDLGNKYSDFEHPLEKMDPYWAYWGNLIRFNWSKVNTSTWKR